MSEPFDMNRIHQIFDRLSLCGCGSDAHWNIIQKLLEMAEDHDKNGSFYGPQGDPLCDWIEFGAKVIDSWHLVEHGTGIGWAWLTEDGKLLLRWLRTFGTEEEGENGKPIWPEGSHHAAGCPCGCEDLGKPQ